MRSINISSWDANSKQLSARAVDDADDVARFATQLREAMQEDSTIPGFELSAKHKEWGTLAVAIAPFGWALVHTSEDHLTQHCTLSNAQSAEESVDVRWEEVTPIPKKWFIPQDQAMDGIRQWLYSGSLSAALSWTDQCY